VGDLLGTRKYGNWFTTQGNAWAMLALASYAEHVETGRAGAQGALTWAAQKQPFQLAAKASVAVTSWPLQADLAKLPLQLTRAGGGRLFSEVQIESRPRNLAQPARDQGYHLQRRYLRVNDDGTLAPLGPDLHVGDRVMVELNFTCSHNASYVALDDPLPSVFEAIHPEFKSQESVGSEKVYQPWETDFRELREDRAQFFRNWVSPGSYTVRYLARVRAAGTATAPAAKIEEMYHPDVFGQTATEKITALPLK
jgi:uncharacterized protein YfaS (alpha-2-macroglobulin family)